MFDITTQRAARLGTLHLKGIDGKLLYVTGEDGKADLEKPVRIHFHGPGSKQAASAEQAQTERALKRLEENDGKPNPATPDVRRKEAAQDLAAMTSHFENLAYPPAGEARGTDLFEALYSDPDLGFVANQGAKFLASWGNFKPGSATS